MTAEKHREWNLKRRQRNFFKVREYYKKHPCVDCGENDPVVLDFDHRVGEKKLRNVSNMMHWSCWDTIKKEIDKCDVRCANCHRRKTAKERNYYVNKLVHPPIDL